MKIYQNEGFPFSYCHYYSVYENNLQDDIDNDTSGNFGRIMYSLVQAARSEDEDVDDDLAVEDANVRYMNGNIGLLCRVSPPLT